MADSSSSNAASQHGATYHYGALARDLQTTLRDASAASGELEGNQAGLQRVQALLAVMR